MIVKDRRIRPVSNLLETRSEGTPSLTQCEGIRIMDSKVYKTFTYNK